MGKKRNIELSNEAWNLLTAYAKLSNIKLPEALEKLIMEKLKPIKEALKSV